jgi:hypothetical protein
MSVDPSRHAGRAKVLSITALALIPVMVVVAISGMNREDIDVHLVVLTALAVAELATSILAVVFAAKARRGGWLAGGIVGIIFAVGGWTVGVVMIVATSVIHWTASGGGGGGGGFGLGGGAWGRPLRIRGQQLHPSLTEGADWTAGPRPSAAGLDEPTRRALEALWLHDAQKEHASVPAFARVSWLLAAAGAPAELLTWAHRAGIEEIEHTQACFALAAGYGGRSHTVLPMPELLCGGLDAAADPRATLAIESLSDGCQLEDYNADVAAACARACREPVTRAVLERIAREERTHAELSWAILGWLVERHRAVVAAPLARAAADLARYPRPTAVAPDKHALVERADAALLRAHGRLPDPEWAAIWQMRLALTHHRLNRLLGIQQPMVA